MSRMGKVPIEVPTNVKVSIDNSTLVVEGPKGKLEFKYRPEVFIREESGKYWVDRINDSRIAKSQQGLVHRIFTNMIKGVTEGYSKTLELVGVGYKAEVSGNKLTLSIGFCHPVVFDIPANINITVDRNFINVSGIDKQRVGEVAAQIRALREPDNYKGKGIRYIGEHVRIKPGKAAVGSGF